LVVNATKFCASDIDILLEASLVTPAEGFHKMLQRRYEKTYGTADRDILHTKPSYLSLGWRENTEQNNYK